MANLNSAWIIIIVILLIWWCTASKDHYLYGPCRDGTDNCWINISDQENCYRPTCKDLPTGICKPGYRVKGHCDASLCNAFNDPNQHLGCKCCPSKYTTPPTRPCQMCGYPGGPSHKWCKKHCKY